MEYRWRISAPGKRLSARIESYDGEVKQFDAALHLKRTPINSASRRELLARYPAMTLRNFARIYWQAIRLRHKGARFYPHPHSAVISSPKQGTPETRELANLVVKTST